MKASVKRTLLAGISALALGIVASSPAWADETFITNHTANATAGGNTSTQTTITNDNTTDGDTFRDVQGIVSEVQNNGANASIDNGNTVSAIIATGTNQGNLTFTTTSDQTATQTGGSTVTETDVTDINLLSGHAFTDAQGVLSIVQNNGQESAINNGNSVSAVILEGTSGITTFDTESNQIATVAGDGNSYIADSSTNDNNMENHVFRHAAGVMSALQNNGANSAINNGNSVSAAILPGGDLSGERRFNTDSTQSATVSSEGDVDVGNLSDETGGNIDINIIQDHAFTDATGVGSALQNNGANSALNNGNTVSAIVTDRAVVNAGRDPGLNDFHTNQSFTSNQIATVTAGSFTINTNVDLQDGTDSPDSNTITDFAFKHATGVFSALQNNGANTAMNNGNTVSAIIVSGLGIVSDDSAAFDTNSEQTATVDAFNAGNNSRETLGNDTNSLLLRAFEDGEGVYSVAQNNGANSAINNGNTVSAIISQGPTDTSFRDNFRTHAEQTALVTAARDTGANGSFQNNHDDLNVIDDRFSGSWEGIGSVVQNNAPQSAINNGNTVSAIIADGFVQDTGPEFNTDSRQTATVDANAGENRSEEDPSPDDNIISGFAFFDPDGVFSVVQNNGANSAINNGNSVSVIIANRGSFNVQDGNGPTTSASLSDDVDFDTNTILTNNQTATVEVLQGQEVFSGINVSAAINSHNDNTIDDHAFAQAEGIFSVVQNNGANSAMNNGNSVSAIIAQRDILCPRTCDAVFDTGTLPAMGNSQTATVDAGDGINDADQNASTDDNSITGFAFRFADGVYSVLQNNAANSAINNGNAVSLIFADTAGSGVNITDATFTATSIQTATVTAATGMNDSFEENGSPDVNIISGEAFKSVQGVASVVQNNGPNSAINNGNTVSAIVNSCPNCTGTTTFTTNATLTSIVDAGTATAVQANSNNTNTMTGTAFGAGAAGVFSVVQNNGPNAAISNGNTVSAIITN